MKTSLGPSIHCNAEWHLRDNPRAIGIYTLAMHLTKDTEGATFFLSQPQIAKFFGWSLTAVKAAFRLLKKSGLFMLVTKGRGGDVRCADFANAYMVRTHAELPKDGKPCYVKPEKVPRAENDPRSKDTLGVKRPSPRAENSPSPRAENDPLVYEESTKKSSSSDAAAPDNPPSASPTRGKPKFSELPDDFEPNDENRALAGKLGVDVKKSLPVFKDYHLGQGDRKKDWNKSFNCWLRNERKFSRHPEPQVTTGSAQENIRRLREQYA